MLERRELMRRVGRFRRVAGVPLAMLGDAAERGVHVVGLCSGMASDFNGLADQGEIAATSARWGAIHVG